VSSTEVADLFLLIVPQVMRAISADLRRSSLDVEPIHLHLLGLLSEGEHSLGQLADVFSVSPPTMSKTISTLEARGWVRRRRSEADRRMVLAHLSPEGRAVLSEARTYAVSRLSEVLDGLDEDELQRLRAGLTVLGRVYAPGFPAYAEAETVPERRTVGRPGRG